MKTNKIYVTIIFSIIFVTISYYILFDQNIDQINIQNPDSQLCELKKINQKISNHLNHNNENQVNFKKNQETLKLGFTSQKNEINIDSIPVKGKIPDWLNGTLYRNGPSLFELDDEEIDYWYDGCAMIHKFDIQNGKVAYSNKFLACDDYTKKKSKIAINNANVNICKICDQYLALAEMPRPVVFEKDNLSTISTFNYEDKLPKDKVYECAHPHIDKKKKEIINYMVNFGCFSSSYDIYKLPFNSKERKLITSISVKEPSFMHSFSITENYIVITEYPFFVNPVNLLFTDEFIEKFEWKPKKGTNVYIIDRNNDKLKQKIVTDPFFSFHHVNSFEQDGNIFIDLISFSNPSIIYNSRTIHDKLSKKKFNDELIGKLQRLKINLCTNQVEKNELYSDAIELPRINEDYDGRPYKFIYAAGMLHDDELDELNQIIKIDNTNKNLKIWKENNTYPGEPIFVPKPNGKSEDDGVILSVVLQGDTNKSFLLILDAIDLKELARAELPHHIPFGFHGQFFPREQQ